MSTRAQAVIGALYGDEGKGLMVDRLAAATPRAVVVRSNGGAQAGHTAADDYALPLGPLGHSVDLRATRPRGGPGLAAFEHDHGDLALRSLLVGVVRGPVLVHQLPEAFALLTLGDRGGDGDLLVVDLDRRLR